MITSRSRRQEFSFEEYYIKVGKLFPQSKINEGCRKCSGITWKGVKVGGILTVKLNLEKRIRDHVFWYNQFSLNWSQLFY